MSVSSRFVVLMHAMITATVQQSERMWVQYLDQMGRLGLCNDAPGGFGAFVYFFAWGAPSVDLCCVEYRTEAFRAKTIRE